MKTSKIYIITLVICLLISYMSLGQKIYGTLKIKGFPNINGDAKESGYIGKIEILDYKLDLTETKPRDLNGMLTIRKPFDASSTTWIQAMFSKADISSFLLEIQGLYSLPSIQTVSTISIENVKIISINNAFNEIKKRTEEEIKLIFSKLKTSNIIKKQEIEIGLNLSN